MKHDSVLCLRVAIHLADITGRGPLVEPYVADAPERTIGAPQGQKFVDLIAPTSDGGAIALEHTIIESYEAQLADFRQIEAILLPLEEQLAGRLPTDRTYHLAVGVGAVRDSALVPAEVQAAVAAWIAETAPSLPAGEPRVAPRHLAHGELPTVPVQVSLYAWPPAGLSGVGGQLKLRGFVGDAETMAAMRVARLARALKDKLPKLLAQAPSQTVLVLEDQDVATSNISDVFLALQTAAEGLKLCDVIVVVETWLPESIGFVVYSNGIWFEDFNSRQFPLPVVE
jgi:hypothetical protein